MNITIIGTGNMARGIGTRLVAGGNSVTLLSRNPEKGAELAANLQAAARQGASAQAVPFGSPLQDEVVVLAVPYPAVAETIQPYRAQLTGKILVDITNPVKATFDGLATPPDSSAAQEIASLVPAETRVGKRVQYHLCRAAGQGPGGRPVPRCLHHWGRRQSCGDGLPIGRGGWLARD